MPYKDPEARRANDQRPEKRAARRERERRQYREDPAFRADKIARANARYELRRGEIVEQQRVWRRDNPEARRAMELKRRYNMTLEQWHEMLIAQSGRCDICVEPMPDPHVDHRHECGTVRKLLCANCNRALGLMGEDPARLRAAADYLERHGGLAHPGEML